VLNVGVIVVGDTVTLDVCVLLADVIPDCVCCEIIVDEGVMVVVLGVIAVVTDDESSTVVGKMVFVIGVINSLNVDTEKGSGSIAKTIPNDETQITQNISMTLFFIIFSIKKYVNYSFRRKR